MAEGFAIRRIQFKMHQGESAQPKPQAPLKGELPPQRLRGAARGYVFARAWANSYNPKRTFYGFASNFIRLWVPTAKPLSQARWACQLPFRGARKTEISIVQKLLYTFLGKCVILSSFGAGGQTRPSVGGGYFPGFLQRECRRFSERRRFRAGLSEIGCLLFAFILRRSRAHFIITYVFTERRF